MKVPLDDLYFEWLYSQVGSVVDRNPSNNYWKMSKLLFKKEFVWLIQNDDNRAMDGIDLRREFLDQNKIIDVDINWLKLGCSMLELMIALSRRLSFEDGKEPAPWFWELMENLGLANFHDSSRIPFKTVDSVLDRVIFRTYEPNGQGGLFPLRQPSQDQRKVELWYQLNAYLIEQGC